MKSDFCNENLKFPNRFKAKVRLRPDETRAGFSGFNSQVEKDKAQSYANEAASIKKGLFLTEKQMQELKAQARQEFEKQIAGGEKELQNKYIGAYKQTLIDDK